MIISGSTPLHSPWLLHAVEAHIGPRESSRRDPMPGARRKSAKRQFLAEPTAPMASVDPPQLSPLSPLVVTNGIDN